MKKKCKEGHYYCYQDSKCKPIPKGYRIGLGGYLRREREDEKEDSKKNGNGKSNGSSNGNGNGGNGSGNGNGSSGGNGGGNGSGGVGENVEIRTANGDLYATIIDIMSSDNMKPILDSKGVWTGTRIEEKDHEYEMIRSQMKTTKKSADRIHKKVKKGEGNIKAWVQSKITKATDYLDGVADYLDNKEE